MAESPAPRNAIKEFENFYEEVVGYAKDFKIWPRILNRLIRSDGSLGPINMIDDARWEKYFARGSIDVDATEKEGGSFGYHFALLDLIDKEMKICEPGYLRRHDPNGVLLVPLYRYLWYITRPRIFFQCLADGNNARIDKGKTKDCIMPLVSVDRFLEYKCPSWITRSLKPEEKLAKLLEVVPGLDICYPPKDLQKAMTALLELPDGQDAIDLESKQPNASGFHGDLHRIFLLNRDRELAVEDEEAGRNMIRIFIAQPPLVDSNFVEEYMQRCNHVDVDHNHELALLLYPFEQAVRKYGLHQLVSLNYKYKKPNGEADEIILLAYGTCPYNQDAVDLWKIYDIEKAIPKHTVMAKTEDADGKVTWHTKRRSKWMKETIKKIVEAHGYELENKCPECHDVDEDEA